MQSTQWTARLGALVDSNRPDIPRQEGDPNTDVEKSLATFRPEEIGIDVSIRLEGPYFSPADPSRYDTVVCLVAGTGISGAIAIAAAFNYATVNDTLETPARKWRRCTIIWSVKESDDIDLAFIEPMAEGLELQKCITGPGRPRVDMERALSEVCVKGNGEGKRAWIYISGPNKYIEAGRQACKKVKRQCDLDFYAASWDI